jgi:hypothetical protein
MFSKYISLYKKPAWLKPASSKTFDNFKFDLQFEQKVDPVWATMIIKQQSVDYFLTLDLRWRKQKCSSSLDSLRIFCSTTNQLNRKCYVS